MMYPLILVALVVSTPASDSALDNGVRQTKNGAFIFRKYPPRALAAGEQGDVRFRASYDKNGYVLGCEVTRGSGYRRLDDETCDLIVRHARFKPALLNDGKVKDGVQDGLVEWRIPGAAAPVAPKVADKGGKLPEKLICRRVLRAGSMIIHTKQCLTKREWEIQADEAKDTVGEAQRRASMRQGM